MSRKPVKRKPVRRKQAAHKAKRRVSARNLWILILSFLILAELIGASVIYFKLSAMAKGTPEINLEDFQSSQSSRVFDVNGEQIADVGLQLRDNITYNDVSEAVVDAFLSVEDSRYFSHDGFDLPRFTKSALDNVKNKILKKGGLSGGSTFTMQLVKLTYFQNEETGVSTGRSVEYKVQQIVLARQLEKIADKKDIFIMYLNKMNFGGEGNIRGIQKASMYYYNKPASQLNIAEAAMLAGVINAPALYDPHKDLASATARRNTVLSLMRRHGYITKKEYNLARKIKVEDTLADPTASQHGGSGNAYAGQAYIDEAVSEASRITGLDPLSTAMDIYTYMDPDVQKVMDTIEADGYSDMIPWPDDLMEFGSIVEESSTGKVVAIGGGRNYGRGGSMLLNHATDQYKQPGSSVKPFLDYALAFEYLGWASDHVLVDQPITYRGTDIVVHNADEKYYGQVKLDLAIARSLNTPAVQTLQQVADTIGTDQVITYLQNLGFSQVNADNFDIGFAIGGSNFTASCEELMAAHAVLANGGQYIKPHTVSRIEFRSSDKEPVVPSYSGNQVLSPEASYIALELMNKAIYYGIWNYLQILERKYATYGKTGTSDWGAEGAQYNIPEGAAKDKWMVAESSKYTIATWVGYEKGIPDADTYFDKHKSELNIPGSICSLVLDAVTKDDMPDQVPMPQGVSEITHIVGTWPYAKPGEDTPDSLITTGMIKTDSIHLVDAPVPSAPAALNSFRAVDNGDGTVTFDWTPYPDEDKLSIAPDTMDLSLKDENGEVIEEAAGTRLYDDTWLFGPIRYKAYLSRDGEVIGTTTADKDTFVDTYSDLSGNVRACGYYGYENSDVKSNEVCMNIKRGAVEKPKEEEKPAEDDTEEKEDTGTDSETEKDSESDSSQSAQ